MTDGVNGIIDPVTKAGYELEFEDTFDGDILDARKWLPYYLPQWSSRAAAAARHELGNGTLRLLITADQPPWCPELDGEVRVSSLQSGVFAGPVGSPVGQHRFNAEAVVREAQPNVRLYTPTYGFFELRAKAIADPDCMVALWMIGYEDEPNRSAEICVCEIFGRDIGQDSAKVGMGVHPFGDPAIVDEFSAETLALDARQFHVYAAEWAPDYVAFLRGPPSDQDRPSGAGLPDAGHARHLRVSRRRIGGVPVRLPEGVRGRLLPWLAPTPSIVRIRSVTTTWSS